MFPLVRAWIKDWVNNHHAGDLRRHHAHCNVIVMRITYRSLVTSWGDIQLPHNWIRKSFIAWTHQAVTKPVLSDYQWGFVAIIGVPAATLGVDEIPILDMDLKITYFRSPSGQWVNNMLCSCHWIYPKWWGLNCSDQNEAAIEIQNAAWHIEQQLQIRLTRKTNVLFMSVLYRAVPWYVDG